MRGRRRFRALAATPRRRRGVLMLATIDELTEDSPRVAFSIARNVGSAVTRNRVRRRLRAAVGAESDRLESGRCYLIAASPAAAHASYAELCESLRSLLDEESVR